MRNLRFLLAAVVGALACFLLTNTGIHSARADESSTRPIDLGPYVIHGAGNVPVTVDDRNIRECFVNMCIGSPGFHDEVILDVGYIRPDPRLGAKATESPVASMSTRLIMSERSARLIIDSLQSQLEVIRKNREAEKAK